MRALVVNQFEYFLDDTFNPTDLYALVGDVRGARFNTLIVTAKGPGLLFWPSRLGPTHPGARNFDLVGAVAGHGSRAGLEAHARLPLFVDGGWLG
jgi:uncharacterized lipoprotein YddW (UPF0748 family)